MRMTTKGTARKKKLQTTLGRAAEMPKMEDDDLDLSHLRKPIDTSIFGLREVLSLFETATAEVKHYVTYECDVIYECRMCRTIFRSLANFILHKRNYCRDSYNPTDHTNCRNKCQETASYIVEKKDINENTKELSPVRESPPKSPPQPKDRKKDISSVLEKLLKKQEEHKDILDMALEDISKENEKDPGEVDDKNSVALEEIEANKVGVFQTMFKNLAKAEHARMDFMKTEVMELHGIFSRDEAVLGPDGKVHSFETEKSLVPKNNLVCTICNQKFSTRKTLTYHIKYKHNNTRMVYPCPVCKDQFANAWCVFRHLYKVHRKTTTQIRKMRDHIHASAFRKDQEPTAKKDAPALPGSATNDSENQVRNAPPSRENCNEFQWMEDIEGDNDFQMCGGCGRRFERKAALHSHSQLCTKRIALCNIIRENSTKQALEDAQSQKVARMNRENQPRGAERRKPLILRRKCAKSQKRDGDTGNKEEDLDDGSEKDADDDYKTEGKSDQEPFCNGNDSNTLDEVILVETVTIDPFRDIEPDCGMLSMENDSLSVFRSSMSPVDVFNIIGVPLAKAGPEEVKADKMSCSAEEEPLCADESSNCASLEQLFQDENLNEDVETAKEDDDAEETIKRKRSSSTEESDLSGKVAKVEQGACTEITLQSKAEKYVDIQQCMCLDCDVAFASDRDLMEHMSQHFNWYTYQCRKCPYMCYYEDTCLLHVRKKHIVDKSALGNMVLPVPSWKSLEMSTDFVPLVQKSCENVAVEDIPKETPSDPATREMIMEVIFGSNVDASNIVNAAENCVKKAEPEPEARPVRNRTKSIKIVQDDFLYDLDMHVKKTSKVWETNNFTRKVMKPLKVYTKKTSKTRKDGNNKVTNSAEKTAECGKETMKVDRP